jgi:ABC-type multidrug transport system permease subunit
MILDLKFILGLVCGFTFLIKAFLHRYLDKKNNYLEKDLAELGGMNPLFLLPYYNSVSYQYRKKKIGCNIIWAIGILLLFFLIFIL